MTTWRDIAERAGEVKGADRGLDLAICEQLGELPSLVQFAPAYTTSVDALLAVVTRKMPGAVWHLMTDYCELNRAKIGPAGRPSASIYDMDWISHFHQADGETPALALTAAFALAMDAMEREGEKT